MTSHTTTSRDRFYIVYPERKWLSADRVEIMYMDALANNEVAYEYLAARTPEEMAEALDDMGFITLANPPFEY